MALLDEKEGLLVGIMHGEAQALVAHVQIVQIQHSICRFGRGKLRREEAKGYHHKLHGFITRLGEGVAGFSTSPSSLNILIDTASKSIKSIVS